MNKIASRAWYVVKYPKLAHVFISYIINYFKRDKMAMGCGNWSAESDFRFQPVPLFLGKDVVSLPARNPIASHYLCNALITNVLSKRLLLLGTSESTQSQPVFL